ncbi:MAG: DUF1294 domain-containing protein [Candidatus Paceibacterota bacterium]
MIIESNFIILSIFAIINIFSFFLMLDDKKKSRKNQRRTSEGALLFVAICFGALGIWAGMLIARHKTQKIIFIVGVPLAFLQNISVLYLLHVNL